MQVASANRWEITFENVPTDGEQRIRISDPNVCAMNSTGASTEGVMANGVTLNRVVDTPGSGIEPGLAFSVSPDGIVTRPNWEDALQSPRRSANPPGGPLRMQGVNLPIGEDYMENV